MQPASISSSCTPSLLPPRGSFPSPSSSLPCSSPGHHHPQLLLSAFYAFPLTPTLWGPAALLSSCSPSSSSSSFRVPEDSCPCPQDEASSPQPWHPEPSPCFVCPGDNEQWGIRGPWHVASTKETLAARPQQGRFGTRSHQRCHGDEPCPKQAPHPGAQRCTTPLPKQLQGLVLHRQNPSFTPTSFSEITEPF